jgi:mannosylglycerate hydrolase
MSSMYNAHFIPNTHLDREWTMDLQRTRKMTVKFLDDLLDIMEKIPEYTFLLDSQAVPLEDYFEIRPEKKEQLCALIQNGRINAGPWYTALDMNCLNGETIVRNMHWGHLTVEQYGPVMKVGYTPFGWGQISQLPQIYKGFDIDMAYFYRGITVDEVPKSEFIWKSPDGTELLTSRFGSGARYNFYFDVWRPALYNGMEERLNRRFNWKNDGSPFKLCNQENRYDHGYVYNLNKEVNPDVLQEKFRELLDVEKQHFGTPEIAFMHGMDTSTPDLREGEIMEEMQKFLKDDEAFFFSSLPRYSAAVKEQVKDRYDQLPQIIGETRHVKFSEYGFSYIANDIISARTRQKYYMSQVESNLQRSAEPYAVMSYIMGCEWPERYLEIGWKQFMKSQAHDTLGGCGVDNIERDAMARLRETNYVANMVTSESLMEVQKLVDTSSIDPDAIILTVYNPSLYNRSAMVEAYVDIPRELEMDSFMLTDTENNPITFAASSTEYFGKVFRDHTDLALQSFADEYFIQFTAEEIPSLGYKTYTLKKGESGNKQLISNEEMVMENEYLLATVNKNGTIDIFNKENGESYTNLNYYGDTGDIGHAWSYVQSIDDTGITTRELSAENSLIVNNAMQAVISSTIHFSIPAATPLSEDRKDWRKSSRDYEKNLKEMEIITEYTLKKGSKTVDISVKFDNQCSNHRLRALFPTHIEAEKSYAESPFDVHERFIKRNKDNPYAHFPHLTFPFARFFGVQSAGRNISIICNGLKEYEALEDKDYSLALTLMRGYENNICTSSDWELESRPGELSQSIGKHEFSYSIYIGETGNNYAGLFKQADSISTPLLVSETKAAPGILPMNHSFMKLDNEYLVFSGMKKASRGDGIIIRLYNITDEEQIGNLTFSKPVTKAEYVNLNEELIEMSPFWSEKVVEITVSARKIVTLVVSLA